MVATVFLRWLHVPEGKDWLDVGRRTGALTQTILAHRRPDSVIGIDASPAFIEHAKPLPRTRVRG